MPACGPKWILTQGHETHRHTTLTISCLVDPASHCQVALHKFSRAVKCASVITVIQFGAELREPCTLEAPVDASFVMLRQAFFGDDLRFQSSSSFKVPHVQIWVRHSQIRPVCSDLQCAKQRHGGGWERTRLKHEVGFRFAFQFCDILQSILLDLK
jgi:hypothetical protein